MRVMSRSILSGGTSREGFPPSAEHIAHGFRYAGPVSGSNQSWFASTVTWCHTWPHSHLAQLYEPDKQEINST